MVATPTQIKHNDPTTRKGIFPLAIILGTLLIVSSAFFLDERKGASKQEHPNILVIFTDQWSGHALGYVGKEKVLTPNLDGLTKEGLALTQMVSNYPVCSPARAMLLTGTYPLKNKVITNANSNSAPFGIELPLDMVCWSDILKAKGYSNGYIGKWHLEAPYQPYIPTSNNQGNTAWNEWTPPARRHGFDFWYAYNTYDQHDRPMYWDTQATRDEFHYVDQWGPEHEAEKAIDFFKNKGNVRNAKNPFALVVSINPPHAPYNTMPKRYLEPYKNIPLDSLLTAPNIPPAGTKMGDMYRKDIKNYYANITGVDAQIGRMISALKDNGLLENTIVLITADHGNCLGKHDEVSKNNIYEESLLVPFLICWKGKIRPGIDHDFLGSMPDIFPTLLDLAGFKSDIPKSIEGISHAPYFLKRKGRLPQEQFIMGSISSDSVRINSGFRGVRTQRYKLAYLRNGKKLVGYLFDLKADPYEMNNLYSKSQPEVGLLKSRLKDWLVKTKDGFVLDEI
jgi:arylsulfatase A-like enzyme